MSTDTTQLTTNAATYMIDQHIAASRGDRNALSYGEKKYSYHDLAALMNRAGNMFRGLSVDREQKILLVLSPSPALVASMLGAMKIGAVPIVISGATTMDSLKDAIEKTNPRAIVVHEDHLDSLLEFGSDAAGSFNVVVVGQNTRGHASFLDLIRNAPSSLAGAEILAGEVAALGFMENGVLRTVSHMELQAFLDSPRGDGPMKSWDIAPTLAAFSKCDEIALSA